MVAPTGSEVRPGSEDNVNEVDRLPSAFASNSIWQSGLDDAAFELYWSIVERNRRYVRYDSAEMTAARRLVRHALIRECDHDEQGALYVLA